MNLIGEEDRQFVDPLLFAKQIGLEQIIPGRYSLLLIANLLGGALSGRQNPYAIVREIEHLELDQRGGFKSPIKNRHPPLKGLWHKHYQQDGLTSFAMNTLKGLDRFGMPLFSQKIEEAKRSGEERYITPEDIPGLVDDIVTGNRQRLANKAALTGEWIIFAKHQGLNYYLTVADHDPGTHAGTRAQIDSVCCVEFPFLADLLTGSD